MSFSLFPSNRRYKISHCFAVALVNKTSSNAKMQFIVPFNFSLLESKKDFFNTFFETDQFQQYVSVSGDGTVEEKYKVGKRVKVAVIVSVQKDNLRKFLESAGIIRKFGLD